MAALRYADGKTNTAAALSLAANQVYGNSLFNRPQFRDIIVLFTDGGSNDVADTVLKAKEARSVRPSFSRASSIDILKTPFGQLLQHYQTSSPNCVGWNSVSNCMFVSVSVSLSFSLLFLFVSVALKTLHWNRFCF